MRILDGSRVHPRRRRLSAQKIVWSYEESCEVALRFRVIASLRSAGGGRGDGGAGGGGGGGRNAEGEGLLHVRAHHKMQTQRRCFQDFYADLRLKAREDCGMRRKTMRKWIVVVDGLDGYQI